MWCPNCRTEYREGITVCADCGATLVEKRQEECVDICELSSFSAAKEILDYLTYSNVSGEIKEDKEDGRFSVTVPLKEKKQAEKLFHGYLLAKEEETEQRMLAEDADVILTREDLLSEEELQEKEDSDGDDLTGKSAHDTPKKTDSDDDTDTADADFLKDSPLFASDESEEDSGKLLYSGNKKEYVKWEDRQKDLKFSGITFMVFGILGGIYLVLCQTDVFPISYHIVVLCILVALFAAFLVVGIVSVIRAGRIKKYVPQEREDIAQVKDYLTQNLTAEIVESWKDENATQGENDLIIAANITKLLYGQYPEKEKPFLEMVADEYYQEQFQSQE